MVELPSKPHSGSCSSVGNESYSLICVLPRRFGVGVYPSSQIYSSLYFVIELSHELMMRKMGNRPCWPPQMDPATIGQSLPSNKSANRCTAIGLQGGNPAPSSAPASEISDAAKPRGVPAF